jgi:NhaA family Na+:H+ antiporter
MRRQQLGRLHSRPYPRRLRDHGVRWTWARLPLLATLVPLSLFTLLVQRRVRSWWLLLPLAVTTWALMHASGVHATVAGVLLGFAVPVITNGDSTRSDPGPDPGPDAGPGLAEHFEHRFRPLSAAVAVPVFAFFAAGVSIGGLSGLGTALTDRAALGVMAGLVIGKPLGIMTATWLVARLRHAHLDEQLGWVDVLGLSLLGGIGFTVSLLIGELAFGAGSARDDHVKVAVLVGSLAAASLAAVILRVRNHTHRLIREAETADHDHDGIPDVHQPGQAQQL